MQSRSYSEPPPPKLPLEKQHPTMNKVLRHGSFVGAIWSMLYGVVQLIVLGLSLTDLNDQRLRADNRQLPAYGGGIDPYRSSMPGLYTRYLDMPERRRLTALFIIHIALMVFSAVHLMMSMLLVYGVTKDRRNFIWPWFPTCFLLSFISVAYAIVWFTGDCFRHWLTIAYFEMLSAIPANAIVLAIIMVYYLNLSNYFDDSARQQSRSVQYEFAKQKPLMENSYDTQQAPTFYQQEQQIPMKSMGPPGYTLQPYTQQYKQPPHQQQQQYLQQQQQQQQQQPPRYTTPIIHQQQQQQLPPYQPRQPPQQIRPYPQPQMAAPRPIMQQQQQQPQFSQITNAPRPPHYTQPTPPPQYTPVAPPQQQFRIQAPLPIQDQRQAPLQTQGLPQHQVVFRPIATPAQINQQQQQQNQTTANYQNRGSPDFQMEPPMGGPPQMQAPPTNVGPQQPQVYYSQETRQHQQHWQINHQNT